MSLQVGAWGRAQCVVTEENTAAAVGSGGVLLGDHALGAAPGSNLQ